MSKQKLGDENDCVDLRKSCQQTSISCAVPQWGPLGEWGMLGPGAV